MRGSWGTRRENKQAWLRIETWDLSAIRSNYRNASKTPDGFKRRWSILFTLSLSAFITVAEQAAINSRKHHRSSLSFSPEACLYSNPWQKQVFLDVTAIPCRISRKLDGAIGLHQPHDLAAWSIFTLSVTSAATYQKRTGK